MENHKCAKCGKNACFMCTNCKTVHYCSRECQKGNWKIHKGNCCPFEVIKFHCESLDEKAKIL